MKAIMTMGVAGSGKSTLASKLKEHYLEINLDECRDLVNGDSDNQSNHKEVAAYRDNLIELAAMQGTDIMISDTNLNPHFRKLLLDKLQQLEFEVTLIVIATPLEKSLEFNLKRERQVPEEVIRDMHKSLEEQILKKKYRHPAIKHIIAYNPLQDDVPDLL